MLHKEWEDLIPFYINQTLPDHQVLALAQHLAHCGACQKALDDWRGIAGALQAAADEWSRDLPPLSKEVRAKVNGVVPANVITMPPPPRITQPLPPAPRRYRQPVFPVIPFVAAVAVGVIVFGGLLAVGMRGFLDSRLDPTQEVAVNWQTNTPRPEETIAPTMTSTVSPQPTQTVSPFTQGSSSTSLPPTSTYTLTPFVPTQMPTLPVEVLSTEEASSSSITRMGAGENPVIETVEIISFYAVPNTVQPGGTVVLNWEVTGASRVQLVADFDGDGVYEFNQDNLSQVASTQVVVPQGVDSSETFFLRVYGDDRMNYAEEAALPIAVQCPLVYFFDCSTGSPVEVSATLQRFENGYILLRNFSGEGLVLFDNGTIGEIGMRDTVASMPPDGFLLPAPELAAFYRTSLGWATDTVKMATLTIHGEAVNPNSQTFTITLTDGQMLEITVLNGNFSGWKRVQ